MTTWDGISHAAGAVTTAVTWETGPAKAIVNGIRVDRNLSVLDDAPCIGSAAEGVLTHFPHKVNEAGEMVGSAAADVAETVGEVVSAVADFFGGLFGMLG